MHFLQNFNVSNVWENEISFIIDHHYVVYNSCTCIEEQVIIEYRYENKIKRKCLGHPWVVKTKLQKGIKSGAVYILPSHMDFTTI